jgi:hypothetical protein
MSTYLTHIAAYRTNTKRCELALGQQQLTLWSSWTKIIAGNHTDADVALVDRYKSGVLGWAATAACSDCATNTSGVCRNRETGVCRNMACSDCGCGRSSDTCFASDDVENKTSAVGAATTTASATDWVADLERLALDQCFGLTALLVLSTMADGTYGYRRIKRVDFEAVVEVAAARLGFLAQVQSVIKLDSTEVETGSAESNSDVTPGQEYLTFTEPLVVKVTVQLSSQQRRVRENNMDEIDSRCQFCNYILSEMLHLPCSFAQ